MRITRVNFWEHVGRASMALVLVSLQACGGGGGGGSEAAPTLPSMVPTPGVPGAVLYADATTLRPLRDGASWHYSGTQVVSLGATPVAYTNVSSHTAAAVGTVTESQSNAGNEGADTQALSASGGVVSFPDSADFAGKGVQESYTVIELRSPVRTGDQWTVLEKRYADTTIDADGDGKADTLDIAVYAQVAGPESVTLAHLPSLQAVRVDFRARARVITSKEKLVGPVSESLLQTWYVAGIGIVRQKVTHSDQSFTEESLSYWNGVDSGFGAMPAQALVAPGSANLFPGQALRGTDLRGFRFGSNSLLMFRTQSGSPTFAAASLDASGMVMDVKPIAGLVSFAAATTAQLTNELVLLDAQGNSGTTSRQLTRIASDGTVLGSVGGVTIEFSGSRLVPSLEQLTIAGDGDRFWVLFRRGYRDTDQFFSIRSELVLRAYSSTGVALTPEHVVAMPDNTGFPTLSASNGRLLLSWAVASPDYAYRHATLETADNRWTEFTLAASLPGGNSFVTPVVLTSGAALLWPAALGTGAVIPYTAGVRLGADYTAIRSSNELSSELLTGVPTFKASTQPPQAVGNRLVFATDDAGTSYSPPPQSVGMARVAWLDTAPTKALASTEVHFVRFAQASPAAFVAHDNRVLVFSIENSQITRSLVWLNSGSP